MNFLIETLLKDPLLAERLARLQSVGDAATALVEAAAARGWHLGSDAVSQALAVDPAQPRELSGAELLAVSGGTRGATRTTAYAIDPIANDDRLNPF